MVQTANTIFRDFVTDGVPASGANKPKKSEVRAWGTSLESMIGAGLSNGGLIYDTKASMDADLAHDANASAWVMTGADAGIYRKSGASGSGSWTKIASLPYSYIKASNVGAGTANALQVTTDIPVPAADGAALIALPIAVDNTASPVTVSFNDSTPLTIKTSAGNDVTSGGLKAGMMVAGYVSGSTFRLLSDQASDAIQAAAEAAKEAAEAIQAAVEAILIEAQAARDTTIGAMSSVVPNIFATKALAEAYAPTIASDFIITAGYTTAGDGGGAVYKKVANEPSHAGKFSITLNDGTTVVWYELAQGQSIYAEMFGAQNFVIGGSQDSTAAFQAASDFVGPHGSWGWRGWHRITGTVTIPYGQSFGPADPVARTSPHYGDFTNWQGAHVNAGWANYGSNLFFDPPSFPAVAFDCDYDIAPHDFTIYADFSAAAIGQNILTTRPETYFNDVTAFRFNKFILASNVGVAGFKWPYRSKGNGSGSGNYYSDLISPEISRCWCFMKVETKTLFNMTVTAPKFNGVNQLFVTDVALRSVRFVGGSIEGWDRHTAIRGAGNAIFFDNTYFETPDNTAVKTAIFYMAAGSSGIISLKGGVTYIDHTTYIVYVDAGAGVWSICTDGLCVISGSGDTAASHLLFLGIATTVYDIGLMTVIADNSIATGIIGTGKAARYTPPTVISGNVTTARNMRLGENSDGVSQNILTAAPASPVSGVLYWANGGTWDPLSRSGGYAYPVIYRGGWQSVGS